MGNELTPKQRRFVEEYLVDLNATQAAIRAGIGLPPCGNERSYYVYLLTDSRDGEIFYVGKGKGKRYAAHVRELNSLEVVNAAKSRRIEAIQNSGAQVNAFCFADNLTEQDAFEIERLLIHAIGIHRLTNAVAGQSTARKRSIREAEMALSRIKPFDQWSIEKPRSKEHCELYWVVVRGYQYIASGQYAHDLASSGCIVV